MTRPAALALALLTVALAGCTGSGSEGEDEFVPTSSVGGEPTIEELDFADRFVVAGVDDPFAYDLEVPVATELAEGLLTWDHPTAMLSFRFLDANGVELGRSFTEEAGRAFVTVRWPSGVTEGVVEVTGAGGADVAFDLHVRLIGNATRFGPIEVDYTLGPGDFGEINLNMVPEDYFNYEWASDADVYFDIHWHRDGQTHTETESTSTSGNGAFTAPEQEIYSLLWANEGVTNVRITGLVDGVYQLHSMSR